MKKLKLLLKKNAYNEEHEEPIASNIEAKNLLGSIFSLMYEPIWYIPLMCFSYIYSLLIIFFITQHLDETIPSFIYIWQFVDLWYAVDISVTIGCQYRKTIILPYMCKTVRPLWVIIVEIISVLPIGICVKYFYDLKPWTYYRLLSIHALKIVRIFYFFYYHHRFIYLKFLTRVVAIICCSTLMVVLGFTIFVNVLCLSTECKQPVKMMYLIRYASIITTWGFPTMKSIAEVQFRFINIFLSTISVFFVTGLLMASGTYDYILATKHKFAFRNRINIFKCQMELLEIKKDVMKKILVYYNIFWLKHRGYQYSKHLFKFLPKSMCTEILLDTYCIALKHSILFRNCEVFLMRFITSLMSQRLLDPGEILYERETMKDKMVYIISGVIQIISEQDGETPILSLSAGTCLGEISLFKSQNCTTTIRCKTFVEIQELHRKDFILCAKYYPEKYKELLSIANERYESAKKFHKMVCFFNKSEQTKDSYTIVWLKQIMHIISEQRDDKIKKNIYMHFEHHVDKLKDMLFKATYLDLLVIAEDFELADDVEFIKFEFPFIFHPNSNILKIWEGLVIICCLSMLYTLPKVIFIKEEIPNTFSYTYRVISHVWLFDLFLQLSTAVIEKDHFHVTFNEIILYRFKTLGFHADLFSTIPLEVFAVISVKSDSGYNLMVMRINRLIKIWRIFRLFRLWENKLHVDVSSLAYVRFTFIFAYIIYVTDCLLFASVCNYPPYDCHYADSYSTLYSAIQIVTGVGILGPYDKKYHMGIVYLLSFFVGYTTFMIMSMFFISARVLKSMDLIKLEKMVIELNSVFKSYKIPKQYSNRMYTYLDTQWQYNRGKNLIESTGINDDIPTYLYKHMREVGFAKILKKILFFQYIPDDIICDICSELNYCILPPNEIVCYAGDYADHLFVIDRGVCEVIGVEKSIKKDYDALNPLTFIYQLPITRTCITKTYCFLITLKYDDLMRTLNRHNAIEALFGFAQDVKYDMMEKLIAYGQIDTSMHKAMPEKNLSFYHFGYFLKPDSFEEYEYFIPFDKLLQFRYIRVFLLRHTINPNGTFFLCWELFRSFIAILSGLFNIAICVIVSRKPFWIWILRVLDIIAYIDIYLRFHVCYHNKKGIIVKHPLKTAVFYLKHNFLLDLIACLPFEMFYQRKRKFSLEYLFLHTNRVLQMYRYLSITYYLGNRHVARKSKLYYFRTVIFLLLVAVFFGSIILAKTCIIDHNIIHEDKELKELFRNGIICPKTVWLVTSSFKKPISPVRAQLYSIYVILSCLSTIGMQGFIVQTPKSGFVTSVLAIIGTYVTFHLLKTIVTFSASNSDILSTYQTSLSHLKDCMKTNKINYNLQQLIISHLDLRWNRQRGKNIKQLMERFHYTLKQDMLYYIYGQTIFENSIFPNEGKKLIKNIIMEATHETFMKNAKIVRVNDINDQIHIIYRGKVDVVAVDGTVLETLGVSAIFGNIDGRPYVRQTMNFVANSIVEVLSLESKHFYTLLSDYPTLKQIFIMTTERFVHYFPCRQKHVLQIETRNDFDEKIEGICANIAYALTTAVYHPDTKNVRVWQVINVIACYVSIIMYMYQLALSEFNWYYLEIQYVCDALYMINYYIKEHLAYENESGMMVSNLHDIKINNRKNKLKFFINLAGVIPLDIISIILPVSYEGKCAIFKLLRVNRLQRLQSILEYYDIYTQKLNIKVNLLQISFFMIYFSLMVHCISCTIIWLATWFNVNMNNHIPTNFHGIESSKKLKILISYLIDTISNISRMVQETNYPDAPFLIIIYIMLMAIYPVIWSIMMTQICIIIFKSQFLKTLFRKKTDYLFYYIKKEEISSVIVKKLQRYINILWIKYSGFIIPYLLNVAPTYISEAILCQAFLKHINSNRFFKKCHVDFKRQLARKFTTEVYFPGDYVTFKNEINNSMYVIHEGNIIMCDEDDRANETPFRILKTSSWFGNFQGVKLLTPHNYSYKAVSNCIVLCLKFEDWKYLLEYFPASKSIILNEIKEFESNVIE